MTISFELNPKASRWLQRRSRELGVSPDALAGEIIEGSEAADGFRVLASEISEDVRDRGLTDEKLTELLDGETYE